VVGLLTAIIDWPQLKRGNREPGIIFQKEIASGNKNNTYTILLLPYYTIYLVEMRNTCQVTNQSSHGELSFHHNPHLRSPGAWAFLLLALFGARAQD